MALEALNILINNTCYQKLPEEWKTPNIETHLTTLSNKAGKWFEDVVSNSLTQVGIHAISSVERYRSQGKIIRIFKASSAIVLEKNNTGISSCMNSKKPR